MSYSINSKTGMMDSESLFLCHAVMLFMLISFCITLQWCKAALCSVMCRCVFVCGGSVGGTVSLTDCLHVVLSLLIEQGQQLWS